MLVLTRKYQEKVRIGDGITITVLRTKGKAVRLGIEAPIDVPVIRGELIFEGPPTDGVEDAVISGSETESNGRTGKVRSRKVLGPAVWSTESHPHPMGRTRDSQATPQVTLRRVPRQKAAEMLPQLLSGNAPLRDMLQQRSRTV